MGNCQTAEAAETVVIQHPGYYGRGKVEIMYCSVSANEIMGLNPGHYVALVNKNDQHVKNFNLKLLRPYDILHIGHVYQLITFEDVIKEFTMKKSMKLVKGRRVDNIEAERDNEQRGSGSRGGRAQWRPALQSIAEV